MTRPNLADICEACFQGDCENCREPVLALLGDGCCCGTWDASNDEDEEELW